MTEFPECQHSIEFAVPVNDRNDHLPSYKLSDDGEWIVCGICAAKDHGHDS